MLILAFAILLVLKLTGTIVIPWIVVFVPLIAIPVIFFVTVLFGMTGIGLFALLKKVIGR